jgi:hypothetical protein
MGVDVAYTSRTEVALGAHSVIVFCFDVGCVVAGDLIAGPFAAADLGVNLIVRPPAPGARP